MLLNLLVRFYLESLVVSNFHDNTTRPGRMEERLVPDEGNAEMPTPNRVGFSVKHAWSKSTKSGRISLIAGIVTAVLIINVVSLLFGRADQGIEVDLDNGPVSPPLPIHHPSPIISPQPDPFVPPPIEENPPAIEENFPPIDELLDDASQRNYSKEAYATLLTPSDPHPWTLGQPDYYFEACKIKAHRLLRNTTTRDPYGRPFVVLVTSAVPTKQIEVLESHGAIVKVVRTLAPPPGTVDLDRTNPRYRDQFTKLHLWNMTEYDRIAFFDADTLPIRAIHTIFDTPPQKSGDEEWLFAAVYDSGDSRADNQRNPPGLDDKGRPQDRNLNAGVFLIWPTQNQSDYIFNIYQNPPQRDWSRFMEQDMLRWAYRDGGPYPWIRLSHLFNTQWPKEWDLDTSYVLHDKLWGEVNRVDPELRKVWYQAWGEMVGWDAPRFVDGILHWQEGLGICNHSEL